MNINFNQLTTDLLRDVNNWVRVSDDGLVSEQINRGGLQHIFFRILEHLGFYSEYRSSTVAEFVATKIMTMEPTDAEAAMLFLETLKNRTHTQSAKEKIETQICRIIERSSYLKKVLLGQIAAAIPDSAEAYSVHCEGWGSKAAVSHNICLVQTKSYGKWTLKYDNWAGLACCKRTVPEGKSHFYLQYEFAPTKEGIPYTVKYRGHLEAVSGSISDPPGYYDDHPAPRLYLTDAEASALIAKIPADTQRQGDQIYSLDERGAMLPRLLDGTGTFFTCLRQDPLWTTNFKLPSKG